MWMSEELKPKVKWPFLYFNTYKNSCGISQK